MSSNRTVIVGDVHGCRDELVALLDRIGFTTGDRLVFVGDLIARGPDSLGVLDVARQTGAIVVRGNHEAKLIEWREAKREAAAEPVALGKMHLAIAESLREVDWTLLETAPLSYDLPEHGIRVVHAGVLPGIAFDEQEPETLMRIRTVEAAWVKGRTRAKLRTIGRGTVRIPWGRLYVGPPHIVFGHNALGGLQVHPAATGLDTGCVYGGRLTAMVLGREERVPRVRAERMRVLVDQPAARVYFRGRRVVM